ncbi:MAG TPA: NTP transferase domain-containing protein [Caulobacteraceae bacterium]|nr:NTP transferase domain-containing protein [Caulobacteraceae bacterium]
MLGAIILTGGASSRMGTDKARLSWGGSRAVDRCVALAKAVGAAAIFTVGGEPLGYPHVRDPSPLGGPVGGILAGGSMLARLGCERGLVLAVDAPTIAPGDIGGLLDQPGAGAAFAQCHLPLVFALERLPASADPGWPIHRLIERIGLARPECRADQTLRLRGANTPQERARLLADAATLEISSPMP